MLLPLVVGVEVPRVHRDRFVACYLGCAALVAILASGKEGSAPNYFIKPLLIVSALFPALIMERMGDPIRAAVLVVLLAVTLAADRLYTSVTPKHVDFASQHGLYQMIEDWLWPLEHYSLANRLPFGYIPISFEGSATLYGKGSVLRTLFYMSLTSPFFIVPFLPFMALALLILGVYRMKQQSESSSRDCFGVLVSACGLGLVLGVMATGGPDVDHLIYASPPLILLLGMALSGRLVKSRLLTELQSLLLASLTVTFTAFGILFLISGPRSPKAISGDVARSHQAALRRYGDPVPATSCPRGG